MSVAMVALVVLVSVALVMGALLTLDSRERPVFAVAVVLAVGLHVAAALSLWLLPREALFAEPEPIAVEVVAMEPEPERTPEPDPPTELPTEPVARDVPRDPVRPDPVRPDPRPQTESPPDAPPPDEPPPAEEAIADFTGETLTNETSETWASATGSGDAIDEPIGQPGAAVTGRRRRGIRGGNVGATGEGPPGPTTVPVSDLSRPPRLPNPERLIELLRRNYPRRARELGIEGTARIRIRIRADGSVLPMAVLSEEYEGFGEACRRTLRQGGRFTAPLDRSGDAVDTITAFTCTFRVRGF